MFITADQVLAHAVGDYIIQSNWMAQNKAKDSMAAAIHAVTYTIPFALITQAWLPLVVICVSHFFIDRFRLARYLVWLKNGAKGPVTPTGYPEDVPPFMSVWLLIIADNIIHVVCNGLALKLL